jgi:hypothetical protein
MTVEDPSSAPQFDDDEEELPRGSRRRLRLDLLLGAAVLVGVLLVGRAMTGHGGKPSTRPTPPVTESPAATSTAPAPARPPSPSEVPITRGNGAVDLVPALPRRTADNPAACPIEQCLTEDAVPAGVLDAVGTVFPHGDTLFKISVKLPGRPWNGALWFRQVNLLVNGEQLLLEIYVPGPNDDVASGTTQDGLVYYHAAFGQYVVALQIDPGAGGTLAKLRALAHDERLVAP